jgi:hypothetical protein
MIVTAFLGDRQVAAGELAEIAPAVKSAFDAGPGGEGDVHIYDDATGRIVELYLAGSAEDVVRRAELVSRELVPPSAEAQAAPAGPGRPRLGVVAREVTLLPRHWEWLNGQPGGASVALRKLVEEARRANADKDRVRQAQETCYRFVSAEAGDRPGYEEAIRALFARNGEAFDAHTASWPPDIREYGQRLAAFGE